jgi:hypothetical protein
LIIGCVNGIEVAGVAIQAGGRNQPLAEVVPPRVQSSWMVSVVGFLAGQGCVAADLKSDFEEEINAIFGLASDLQP